MAKGNAAVKAKKGQTYEEATSCGVLYVTCNDDPQGKLMQIFCRLGKAGGCAAAHMRAYGILFSQGLKLGMKPDVICNSMKGIGCHQPMCCIDAVGRMVERHEEGKCAAQAD